MDLTQATLKEWALKNGLDADIESMTQAEKTMLRYQYVLANTVSSQNDFSRTSNTWANQVRILKQSFEQLASIIGGALINAFKPFVQTLNKVLLKVISFAQQVVDALGTIFGWKYEISGGGVAQDWVDDMEDLTDSEDDATDSAKELKKTIASFDEIHALNDNSSSSSSDSTSGTDTVDDSGIETALVKTESIFDKYKSDIDNLYDLGEYISKALRNMLADIDWDSIYEKARGFGTGLAEFLNGLVRPDTFYQVGRTLANSLNTVVYAALAFAETLDWANLGESIAAGINGFFFNWDAKAFAENINKWVQGIFTMFITAVKNVKWTEILKRIGEFLSTLEIKTVAIIIGALAIKKIVSMHIVSSVLSQIASAISADITAAIAKKLGTSAAGTTIGGAIWSWIKKGVTSTSSTSSTLIGTAVADNLSSKITAAFSKLSTAVKVGIGGASVATEFLTISRAMQQVATSGEVTARTIAEVATGAGVAVAALKLIGLSNPFTALITGATALAAAIYGISKSIKEAEFNTLYTSMKNIGNISVDEITAPTISALNTIKDSYQTTIDKINSIDSTKESLSSTVENLNAISGAIELGAYTASEKMPELVSSMQDLLNQSNDILTQERDLIIYSLAGATGEALKQAGVDITNLAQYVVNATNELMGVNEQNYQELLEIQERAKAGEDVGEQLYEWMEKVNGINVDDATNSLNNFNATLDLSKYMTENGFDAETFVADLAQLGDAADSAKETAITSINATYDALDNLKKQMEQQGYDTSVIDWDTIYGVREDQIADTETQIKAMAQSTMETLQQDALNQVPQIVEQASADYKNLKWWQKLFKSEGSYVSDALEEWKSTVVDPMSEGMQTELDALGIDGSTWIGEAAEGVIASMWSTTVYTSENGVETTAKALNGNWKDCLKQACEGLKSIAEGYGEDTIEGYSDGAGNTTVQNKAGEIIGKFASFIKDKFHNSVLSFGSPSKTMEQYGEWTVEGYNNGIDSKQDSVSTLVSTMANSVVSGFSNVYNSLYSAGSFIMQGLLGGISSMASSIYKKAAEIASNVASKISSVLKIGSPSKVMFEIGDFTMQGFELGMESNFDSIVEGVQTMASEVVEAPMPTLSNLTATAQSVDMSGYGEQSSKAISNSNIVSSSETNTLLRELISAVKDGKTITIDGREIGRTSVDYINKETRRGSTPLLSY